jgi:hypothetical protein
MVFAHLFWPSGDVHRGTWTSFVAVDRGASWCEAIMIHGRASPEMVPPVSARSGPRRHVLKPDEVLVHTVEGPIDQG